MGVRVGVCGLGGFGGRFIDLFKYHPELSEVVLCDLKADLLKEKARKHNLTETCPSLDGLCQTDVDAIALFTQHHIHGAQAVQALRAGKHVYSAVPPAITIRDVADLVRAVEETGRIYMLGETSYYYPCAIYCRERFRKGDFGHVVYSEAEYYHDYSHGGDDIARARYGRDWRHYAGMPPMYYPTHSMSLVVSVTGAYATHVSGMGFVDREEGTRFVEDNYWANRFSNETMLCRMSDGSIARLNEFRRVGHPGRVSLSMYGTEGSYEEHTGSRVWVTKEKGKWTDLTLELESPGAKIEQNEDGRMKVTEPEPPGSYGGARRIHPVHLLPKEYEQLPNGHLGSHQFLVNEFVNACSRGENPLNNVWQAARYVVPGLIAHESAKRGGELMEVPDFGEGPVKK